MDYTQFFAAATTYSGLVTFGFLILFQLPAVGLLLLYRIYIALKFAQVQTVQFNSGGIRGPFLLELTIWLSDST